MRISDWSSDVCSSDLNIGWSVAGARGFAIEAYGTNGRLRIEAPSGFPDAGNAALFHAPAGPREALGKPEEPVELPATLRTEERRGGKECVSRVRSRWLPFN